MSTAAPTRPKGEPRGTTTTGTPAAQSAEPPGDAPAADHNAAGLAGQSARSEGKEPVGWQAKQPAGRPRGPPPKPNERSDQLLGGARAQVGEKAAADKAAAAAALARSRNAVLQSRRYAINACLWRTGADFVEATGSILSQSVEKALLGDKAPGKYAGDLSLAQLRKFTPGMSAFARIHRFCTSDGTVVSDESVSLADYLALDANEDLPAPKIDSKGERQKAEAPDATKDKTGASDPAHVVPPSDTAAVLPKALVPKLTIYFRIPPNVATAGMDLSNVSAPPVKLDLRPFGSAAPATDPINAAPTAFDANGNPVAAPRLAAPTLESKIDKDRSFAMNLAGKEPIVTAGNLSEDQWSFILRNCSVFYGWKVNFAAGHVTRAPRAAFQLRAAIGNGLPAHMPVFATDDDALVRKKVAAEDAEFERSVFESANVDSLDVEKLELQNMQQNPRNTGDFRLDTDTTSSDRAKAGKAIPNFRVNDDSRIEIAACLDSLAVSLAKSDFSSQSTEASVAGGAYGVTLGVSGGYANSSQNNSQSEKTGSTQTLVARYMFPRCDLFLRPEDLELTPDFAALLTRIKVDKSIDAVRAMHEQYGHLFCQELTLGARLLTTKIITASKTSEIDQHKEQMKVSVGVSVSSPVYGGASVKHEQESGKEITNTRITTNSRETNVFEAVGGDTILANNPPAWSATVASPNLWRVINREGLASMTDMISEMPGFEQIQSWLVQAVPALSKYVRLDAAYSVNVRFKVLTPTENLAIQDQGNALFYLGFDPSSSATPRLNGISVDAGLLRVRVDLKKTYVLFHPASFRAPCLHGFKDFQVGNAAFGSAYNSKFAETQWSLLAPSNYEFGSDTTHTLKHGSKIVLRSVPYRNTESVVPSTGNGQGPPKETTPPPSHMIVFRNAQGIFLPGISDSDEYQYWRIEKIGARVLGEPVKEGDSIRLAWRFADQVSGFRDYLDDSFGRRRNQCPVELESSTLYLKVPWPRFEVRDTPTAMVMSAQSGSDEMVKEMLPTRHGTYQYTLQGLQFRIDTVERRGLGDSSDYMLAGVKQGADEDFEPQYFTPPKAVRPVDPIINQIDIVEDALGKAAGSVAGGVFSGLRKGVEVLERFKFW